MNLAKRYLPQLRALDWASIAWKAALVIVILGGVYYKGRVDATQKCAQKEVKAAKAVVKEIQMFVPIANKQEQKAAERNARVEKKQEVYNDEVDRRRRPTECDLTPSELQSFQDLVTG